VNVRESVVDVDDMEEGEEGEEVVVLDKSREEEDKK
jgi:hypothetical protein